MYDHDRMINARAFGARGNGQTDDTAALVSAFAAAAVVEGVLYLPRGLYPISASLPPITWQRGGVQGDPGATRIKSTAPGVLLSIDGGAVTGAVNGPVVRDIDLEGNAGTTDGLFLRACVRGEVRNVRIISAASSGVRCDFVSLMVFDNVVLSVNEESHAALPTAGIRFGARGPGEKSTACTVRNPCIEGLGGGVAILIDHADLIVVEGGALQGNLRALEATANGGQHHLRDVWCEANAEDVLVDTFWCQLDNVKCNSRVRFGPNSYASRVRGGCARDLVIEENEAIGDQAITLDGPAIKGANGQGWFVDNGRNTRGWYWDWGAGARVELANG